MRRVKKFKRSLWLPFVGEGRLGLPCNAEQSSYFAEAVSIIADPFRSECEADYLLDLLEDVDEED